MLPVAFLGLGLIIGSFLNVLIVRWGVRPLSGRSACVACGATLAWYDLVPVLSWLLLRGRCRSCKARISVQYPLVEGGTALLFLLVGLSPLPLYQQLLALPIAALLVAIAAYDIRHTLIPDGWAYAFAGLSLAASLVSAAGSLSPFVLVSTLLAGPIVALPLFALWFFSHGRWMGFGDVKLALGMGWLLGVESGLVALFLAFIVGACVSVPLLFFSSEFWGRLYGRFTPMPSSPKFGWGFTMKSEVPFGPFLITATFIVWLLNMHGLALIDYLI